MAQINMPSNRGGAMERLAAGLGIANSILGIKQSIDKSSEDAKEKEKLARFDDPNSEESKQAYESLKGIDPTIQPGISANAYERRYGKSSDLYAKKFASTLNDPTKEDKGLLGSDKLADFQSKGLLVPPGTKDALTMDFRMPGGKTAQYGVLTAPKEKNAAQVDREMRHQEKLADRELRLAVPGFQRTGEVLPKDEEAQKFRDATAQASQLKTKLDRLKELVKENGSFEYGGDAGQEMASLATEIQLLSKSDAMYQLGVLTGPDMSLLQKITANPDSISSLFTRDDTRLTQIDTQLKSIQDKLDAKSKSLGYVANKPIKPPKDYSGSGGSPFEAAQASDAPPKPKRVTQNGHVYILNEKTGEYE